MTDTKELIERLRSDVTHYECEDCWYSCATLTCNEDRVSDVCDCGAAMRKAALDELERLTQALAEQTDESSIYWQRWMDVSKQLTRAEAENKRLTEELAKAEAREAIVRLCSN